LFIFLQNSTALIAIYICPTHYPQLSPDDLVHQYDFLRYRRPKKTVLYEPREHKNASCFNEKHDAPTTDVNLVDAADPKGKPFFAHSHHFTNPAINGRGWLEKEARQICTKVSKYLFYVDKTHLQEGMLLNAATYNGHVPVTFGG